MSKIERLLEQCRKQEIKLVVIGTSAGGIEALRRILPAFRRPSDLIVALVLHLPSKGPNLLPEIFGDECHFLIKEAESQEPGRRETIYVAPPNYHLSLEPSGNIGLSSEELVNFSRPSIDILFESAAYSYGNKCLAMLLTGANNDGAQGLRKIRRLGGIALIQDPQEAQYPAMPQSGLELVPDAQVCSISEIADFIKMLSGEKVAS